MGKQARLVRSVHSSQVAEVRKTGLKAGSEYADLGLEMRRGVVYCWLRQEDDKLGAGGRRPGHVYVEVMVDEDRCVVADMDLISIALMYQQGSGGKPENAEASRLLAQAYQVTSVPLAEYTKGLFFTPEVLVKGDIAPDAIRIVTQGGE